MIYPDLTKTIFRAEVFGVLIDNDRANNVNPQHFRDIPLNIGVSHISTAMNTIHIGQHPRTDTVRVMTLSFVNVFMFQQLVEPLLRKSIIMVFLI